MTLPIGFDRKDSRVYEQVDIPPTEKAPMGIGQSLVNVSDLDEVS